MKISVFCTGGLRERYWSDASNEYVKRIKRFSNIEIQEFKEEICETYFSEAMIQKVKEKESAKLMDKLKNGDFCIAMDPGGKQLSSVKFAGKISELLSEGKSNIVFLIGGSFGLSEECLKKADFTISMSEMTFPHQMARVILLEQIYRAFKINAGEVYHK